jgi:hypothetical protein
VIFRRVTLEQKFGLISITPEAIWHVMRAAAKRLAPTTLHLMTWQYGCTVMPSRSGEVERIQFRFGHASGYAPRNCTFPHSEFMHPFLVDAMINPANSPLRFDGPVCFLIGNSTFSSAMMLANAVADFKLATLIREETGDPPTAFGELYTFTLPHSRFTINVSTAHFVRANGDATDQRPVLPDIKVLPPEGDWAQQLDAVLEYAKKWVLHKESVKPGQSLLAK